MVARLQQGRPMTITKEDELTGLKHIGRIVANTMAAMARAMEPGMTTRELDEIGVDCGYRDDQVFDFVRRYRGRARRARGQRPRRANQTGAHRLPN